MGFAKKIPGLIIGLGMAGGCIWLATRKNLNRAIEAMKNGNIGDAWRWLTDSESSKKTQGPAQKLGEDQRKIIPTGEQDDEGWFWHYEGEEDVIHKSPFVTTLPVETTPPFVSFT